MLEKGLFGFCQENERFFDASEFFLPQNQKKYDSRFGIEIGRLVLIFPTSGLYNGTVNGDGSVYTGIAAACSDPIKNWVRDHF